MSFAQLFVDLRSYVSDFHIINSETPLVDARIAVGVPLFYLSSLYFLKFLMSKRSKGFDLIHVVAFHNFFFMYRFINHVLGFNVRNFKKIF